MSTAPTYKSTCRARKTRRVPSMAPTCFPVGTERVGQGPVGGRCMYKVRTRASKTSGKRVKYWSKVSDDCKGPANRKGGGRSRGRRMKREPGSCVSGRSTVNVPTTSPSCFTVGTRRRGTKCMYEVRTRSDGRGGRVKYWKNVEAGCHGKRRKSRK